MKALVDQSFYVTAFVHQLVFTEFILSFVSSSLRPQCHIVCNISCRSQNGSLQWINHERHRHDQARWKTRL